MMRPALPADAPAIKAFLARDVARTMFLRGNLARHGLGSGAHPQATTFHLWSEGGALAGVLGLTQAGMVLPYGPQAGAFGQACAGILAGQALSGFTGDAKTTGALIAALGYGADAFRMNHVEPLFVLDLARLPSGNDTIRPTEPADAALLGGWFATYLQETGLGAGDPAEAQDRPAAAIAGGPARLLVRDSQPVAMASLNARAGTAVQVGGVFVPRAMRNRGLGRAVTRALLSEAREDGADEAVLFANTLAVARAYAALGFRQVGQYRIAFLHRAAAPG